MSKSILLGRITSKKFTTVDVQQSRTFTQSRTLSVSSTATIYTPAENVIVDAVWIGNVDGTNTEGQVSVVELDSSNNILNVIDSHLTRETSEIQLAIYGATLETGKRYALARRTTQGDGRVILNDGYFKVYLL